MKKRNLLPLGISLLVLITGNTLSQIALSKEKIDPAHLTTGTNDTAFAKTDTNSAKAIPFNENIRVQRSFILNFGDTSENNWCKVGNHYLNYFHLNGLRAIALFSKKGQLIYTIRYGSEKDLPADFRRVVKSQYYDYTIQQATEVKENGRDVWFVILEDATELITVKVEDYGIERVQRLQK